MTARRLLLALSLLAACGDEAPAPGTMSGPKSGPNSAAEPAPQAERPAAAEAPQPARPGVRAVSGPTAADREAHDFPSLATRSGGDAWLAAVQWDGKTDGLELGQVNKVEETANLSHRVYTSPTRLLFTASAADASDALHVLFCEQAADGWALRELVAPSSAEGADSSAPPRTLRAAPGRACVEPALAADEHGALLATWVEVAADGLSLWAAALGPEGWSAPVEVSGQRASNWSPSVCATGPGAFAIAWDAAVDGDYDVQLARLVVEAGQPRVTSRHRVTDSPRFEAHASVTSFGERLYVAWDVGPERWGREGSSNVLAEALHSERTIRIAAVEGEQVAPLSLQPTASMSEALAQNCELPRIVAEGKGALVLMFRGLPLPREIDDPDSDEFGTSTASRNGGVGWRTSIWITFMTRLDGAVWSFGEQHHMGIPESKGRCDSPGALTRRPKGGVVVAASGDGRDDDQLVATNGAAPGIPDPKDKDKVAQTWWQPITKAATRIVTRLLKAEPLAREIETGPWRQLPAPREPQPRATLPTRAAPGGTLQLALGDLHRHTDISRCSSNWDGPISDALRYAFDVAPLDFLAITDHFDHMTKYDWWRETALVDAWNSPGRMTGLRGYERADMRSGHRNVISAGDGPPLIGDLFGYEPARDAGRADTPAELWPLLAGSKVLTIPHTPAGMTLSKPEVFDWGTFNPAFDRAIEIFQSYRGGSEASGEPRSIKGLVPERYVRPNLDLGMQFGLVAGSDHQTSDGAFTGAWVTGPSREQVFDAIFERRTFASTVRGSLWTEWAGVPMGGAAPVPASSGAATFRVEADGFGRALKTIELISDGAVAGTREVTSGPGAVTAEFPLDPPTEGSRYAYARVTFTDGEMMWGSPVRLFVPAEWNGPDGPSGKDIRKRLGDVWKLTTDPLREKMNSNDGGH